MEAKTERRYTRKTLGQFNSFYVSFFLVCCVFDCAMLFLLPFFFLYFYCCCFVVLVLSCQKYNKFEGWGFKGWVKWWSKYIFRYVGGLLFWAQLLTVAGYWKDRRLCCWRRLFSTRKKAFIEEGRLELIFIELRSCNFLDFFLSFSCQEIWFILRRWKTPVTKFNIMNKLPSTLMYFGKLTILFALWILNKYFPFSHLILILNDSSHFWALQSMSIWVLLFTYLYITKYLYLSTSIQILHCELKLIKCLTRANKSLSHKQITHELQITLFSILFILYYSLAHTVQPKSGTMAK